MTTQQTLAEYCQGFKHSSAAWPHLPLSDDISIDWWRELLAEEPSGVLDGDRLVTTLQLALPQLRLPQRSGVSKSEQYRTLVLRGEAEKPGELEPLGPLPVWRERGGISLKVVEHPCGAMPVLQTPCWPDFLMLVRALAHRCEPATLAKGVHAQGVSGLIHWGLIRRLGPKSRAALIVLHVAPYGSVHASQVPGCPDEACWLDASTTLRLEHELTHLATKRLLGEMRLNLLDELIADAMGMIASLGGFHASLFCSCLGLDEAGRPVPGKRWQTYVQSLKHDDALQAIHYVVERAQELEAIFKANLSLLRPEFSMARLEWLCRQRLDHPITEQ
jgi:hypothetical protein